MKSEIQPNTTELLIEKLTHMGVYRPEVQPEFLMTMIILLGNRQDQVDLLEWLRVNGMIGNFSVDGEGV